MRAVGDGVYDCIRDQAATEAPHLAPPQSLIGIKDISSSTDAVIVNGAISTNAGPFQKFQIAIPYKFQALSWGNDPTSDAVQVQFAVVSGDSGEATGDQGFDMFIAYSRARQVMRMSDDDFRVLREVAKAQQGIVGGLPDQYWRMLYFSAVTETTLGFGDITPVSTMARNIVTAQAVIGVVAIGLFLNALTRRREEPSIPNAISGSWHWFVRVLRRDQNAGSDLQGDNANAADGSKHQGTDPESREGLPPSDEPDNGASDTAAVACTPE